MTENNNRDVLLEVKNLRKYFATARGPLHAVDRISFQLERGKTLGVVGESGCGKSTLGRTILGLIDATDGEILFENKNITHLKGRAWKEMRKEMQIVFQDPMASLNPRFTVFNCIAEPLKIFKACQTKEELEKRVLSLMDTVGLAERLANSYPHELDGGRRQRIGIARALALMPKFILCDEPVSALDVSIQAQILNLLQDLQEQQKLTYIFVTHDMSVVKHISDEILVMYLGCMAEKAPAKELFKWTLHPYTKGLISAIPVPDIDIERKTSIMSGELSSPVNPKPGCRFAARCPYTQDKCTKERPPLKEELPNHFVACHFCREINGLD